MGNKLTARVLRADDFLAESLEAEANLLPPSEQAKADILRNSAKLYRESTGTKMVRVWEP